MRKEETTPLYKQLIEDFKKLIEDGKYKQGELLNFENDLCKTFTPPGRRQGRL